MPPTTTPALAQPVSGLDSVQAAARLVQYGPNLLIEGKRRALVLQILARFRNPLVLLLLVASAVSAFTRDLRSAIITSLVVVLSVTLDFVQEHRADRAAEKLRKVTGLRASVLRDGQLHELPAAELVPGDVIALSAGDLVPADAVLLEAHDLFVNQALLTGEPYPVEKQPAAHVDAQAVCDDPSAATSCVFMGSSVLSGSARALVQTTGSRTSVGKVGLALTERPPSTAFEQSTRSFGLLILRLALLLVLFVILVNVARGRPGLESFIFAIALAVGLTPELLPMVISVTLARGALRMSQKRVLVKRLSAIQDLGSMDVLCTDKTGTLTEAQIRLEQHLDADGNDSPRVLELAYVNSRFETGLRSPLDEAILRHADLDVSAYAKLDEVPFDFERRRVSVLVQRGQARMLVVKGAFEDVLALCTECEANDQGRKPIDAERRRALHARFEQLASDGFRVLGIAWKEESPSCEHARISDETELVFAGFAAFEDPPKASARSAVRSLREAGVTPVIVTGDSELVAQHVCRALEIPVTGVIIGPELEKLDEPALRARLASTNLFCRVNPTQKRRVIMAFKHAGHVVGYLGDGINDAPSLHAADVGISVDGAVDIAKEAADMILLDHDLAVLQQGVLEGRKTLGNILKYIMMGTSSNFGNMFSMAGASLFLPFLPMLPVQILVNNFLYDLSEIPIPSDEVDPEFIARPQRMDMTFIRRFMLAIGPVSSIFDFATFWLLLQMFGRSEAAFQTGWFVESLATQVLVIFVIRTRGNPLRSRASRPLTWTSIGVVLSAMLLPLTPLAAGLGFTRLPLRYYGLLCLLVAVYLVTVECVKRLFYRHAAQSVA